MAFIPLKSLVSRQFGSFRSETSSDFVVEVYWLLDFSMQDACECCWVHQWGGRGVILGKFKAARNEQRVWR